MTPDADAPDADGTPEPRGTPRAGGVPVPDDTPRPGAAPNAGGTPEPRGTPEPDDAPGPGAAPDAGGTPEAASASGARSAARPGGLTGTGGTHGVGGAGIVSELDWRPSRHARALAGVALVAALCALLLGRAAALLIALPSLVALALGAPVRPGARLRVTAAYGARRCFENEDVVLAVTLATDGPTDRIRVRLDVADGVEIVEGPPSQTPDGDGRVRWTVRFGHWGRRRPGRLTVELLAARHTRAARVVLDPGEVAVYPAADRLREILPHHELLARAGEHLSRAAGAGVEFLGIRPYQPGDPPRAINRLVSARTGRLYVNQRADERAADLVIMIDAMTDIGPPGATSLDVAVRAAATLARGYLRHADRVGIVTLGGIVRWLAPGVGGTHLYRVTETLIDARGFPSAVTPDLDRVPRTALPPRASVIVLSPLVDERAIGTIADLRRRGHPTTVLDTLTIEPTPDGTDVDRLALRLWRLDRRALRLRLANHGVPVTSLHSPTDLNAALATQRTRFARAAAAAR